MRRINVHHNKLPRVSPVSSIPATATTRQGGRNTNYDHVSEEESNLNQHQVGECFVGFLRLEEKVYDFFLHTLDGRRRQKEAADEQLHAKLEKKFHTFCFPEMEINTQN